MTARPSAVLAAAAGAAAPSPGLLLPAVRGAGRLQTRPARRPPARGVPLQRPHARHQDLQQEEERHDLLVSAEHPAGRPVCVGVRLTP